MSSLLLFHELELHQNDQVGDHRADNLKLNLVIYFDFKEEYLEGTPLLGDPC
jgi:hypothetical protein